MVNVEVEYYSDCRRRELNCKENCVRQASTNSESTGPSTNSESTEPFLDIYQCAFFDIATDFLNDPGIRRYVYRNANFLARDRLRVSLPSLPLNAKIVDYRSLVPYSCSLIKASAKRRWGVDITGQCPNIVGDPRALKTIGTVVGSLSEQIYWFKTIFWDMLGQNEDVRKQTALKLVQGWSSSYGAPSGLTDQTYVQFIKNYSKPDSFNGVHPRNCKSRHIAFNLQSRLFEITNRCDLASYSRCIN